MKLTRFTRTEVEGHSKRPGISKLSHVLCNDWLDMDAALREKPKVVEPGKIVEYAILSGRDAQLSTDVLSRLSDGWELYGPLVVDLDGMLFREMVRREPAR